MEATIKRMAAEGHSDAVIAAHLTEKGHRSPQADKVLESTVQITRLRMGILRTGHQSHPRRVEGFLTIPQLTKKLGVSPWWIYDRIHNGTIKAKKDENKKCYLFPDSPPTLAELEALVAEYQSKIEVPDLAETVCHLRSPGASKCVPAVFAISFAAATGTDRAPSSHRARRRLVLRLRRSRQGNTVCHLHRQSHLYRVCPVLARFVCQF